VKRLPTLIDRVDQKIFDAVTHRSLVYNTCWEDPAVDRQALQFHPDDTVLVITSAGCNALDYAAAGVRRVHAVDANPRQNALLELKMAAIRRLEYEDFFALFGHGYHERFATFYQNTLRWDLSDFARDFWDQRLHWFVSPHGSFYFHSLAGLVARSFRAWFRSSPGLQGDIAALFSASGLEEQRTLYRQRIRPQLWSRPLNWLLGRQITLSLLGVPHPQRREVQAQHPGGVAGFIREAVEYVVEELPLRDNYFWRVYFGGRYTPDCCPEYLTEAGFSQLKAGGVDRIRCHTTLVTDFLQRTGDRIDKFVLLDHMDWMSCYHPEALVAEWNAILDRASPGARIIFRSAHARPAYLDWIEVGEAHRRLRHVLTFHDDLARRLSLQDRVHTYAGFHIADVAA
jgi:S-adenosylmethionine-diacylglycerol 3-amino-3-carboxypropyl transferase